MRRIHDLMTIALAMIMAACGGGGNSGGSAAPVNSAPTVDVGAAQYVVSGSTVALQAVASDADGDALTYSWSLVANQPGSSAVLANANTATPTFVSDTDPRGFSYTATVAVSDGKATAPVTRVVAVTATAPGVALVEVVIGGEELNTLTYARTRTQTITTNLNPVRVATYRLIAQGGPFTIHGLAATGGGTGIVPSIAGLTEGQVLPSGQPVTFVLQSTPTRGAQVTLHYGFDIPELISVGGQFAYKVVLTTN